MMDEQFLHYIWKFQKFNPKTPALTDGSTLQVFKVGCHNRDSGPDFEEAHIKINEMEWVGHVEIHTRSSDWMLHNHQRNSAYDTVILHVVWKHDKTILVKDSPLPTLELKSIVSPDLCERYMDYIDSKEELPCSRRFHSISALRFESMLSRVVVERLREKAVAILEQLENTRHNWEEVAYRSIASSFGFSTNKLPFHELAKSLPFKIVSKHSHVAEETEALIFGQAGFLDHPRDEYARTQQKTYSHLARKYRLTRLLDRSHWKFGKMRPPALPTVRLAQFSALLSQKHHLFSNFIELSSPKDVIQALKIDMKGYWRKHYDFGKTNKSSTNSFGHASYYHIAINTIAPLFAAYSRTTDDYTYMDKAMDLLESLPKETNRMTKHWEVLDRSPKNAFASQAMIGLFKNYCSKKRCLSCEVGTALLNRE